MVLSLHEFVESGDQTPNVVSRSQAGAPMCFFKSDGEIHPHPTAGVTSPTQGIQSVESGRVGQQPGPSYLGFPIWLDVF